MVTVRSDDPATVTAAEVDVRFRGPHEEAPPFDAAGRAGATAPVAWPREMGARSAGLPRRRQALTGA